MAAAGHRAGATEATGVEPSGHERMFNGWAAASGERRIDFSAEVAWFGDILENLLQAFVAGAIA